MSNELVQTGFFDIELDTQQKTWHIGLEDKLQATLRQRAQKIKAVNAYALLVTGEELAAAQQELRYKDGGFVKWVEEETDYDFQTGYEIIKIWNGYKLFRESRNISSLGKSVLLKSSKSDVPESARQEIVTRHEAGEKITLAVSDEIIERHKARIEELEEENEELQGKLDLFEENRERERSEFDLKIKTAKNEKSLLEDEILGYKQTKAVIDQKIRANDQELARLKEELEKKSEPEKVEVEVEKIIIPPEKEKEIEDLKESIAQLVQDQIELQKEQDKNAKSLEESTQQINSLLKENRELERQLQEYLFRDTQQKHNEQTKTKWRQFCDAFYMGYNQASARWVSPIDAHQAFEYDHMAQLDQMITDAFRFAERLAQFKKDIHDQFVDVSIVDSPKYIEAPLSYIEG